MSLRALLVRKDLVAGLAFGLGTDACQWQAHRTDKTYGTDISCWLGLILFYLRTGCIFSCNTHAPPKKERKTKKAHCILQCHLESQDLIILPSIRLGLGEHLGHGKLILMQQAG